MKVVSIVGARPQFVKMAAVSRAIAAFNYQTQPENRIKETTVHTGQHYDHSLSQVFFEELHIPKPKYNLNVGSASHGVQTGEMLKRVERTLLDEQPDLVLVYGDTNSTLAGALAATKLNIPVAHVEAGLRSYRKHMPEEVNRVLTDHVSSILFCPSNLAVDNLRQEGKALPFCDGRRVNEEDIQELILEEYSVDNSLVINVGDVMYDHLLHSLAHTEEHAGILEELDLEQGAYYLATVHRASNTDCPNRLQGILHALNELAEYRARVVFPVHPRTKKTLSNLTSSVIHPNVHLLDPVSYYEMLSLERHARLILTDSGGVQKEAFLLGVRCVTLREETEWLETVDAGWNILAGTETDGILDAVTRFEDVEPAQAPPEIYGDGRAAEYIVRVLKAWAISHEAP